VEGEHFGAAGEEKPGVPQTLNPPGVGGIEARLSPPPCAPPLARTHPPPGLLGAFSPGGLGSGCSFSPPGVMVGDPFWLGLLRVEGNPFERVPLEGGGLVNGVGLVWVSKDFSSFNGIV